MLKAIGLLCFLFTQAPPPQQAASPHYPKELRELLASKALEGSETALVVKRLKDSAPLFEHNPDALLVPASTIKLFTTALALETLGPDYRFVTELHGKLGVDGTSIDGDLYIKGYGDPWLVPERLWLLSQQLKASGIIRITGGLVIDDSYFSGPGLAAGIEQDTSSKAYMAPAGAVSLGFNAVAIHIRPHGEVDQPAHIYIEPGGQQMVIEGAITTTDKLPTNYGIEIEALGTKNKVVLSGNIHPNEAPRQTWRRITNPPHHAGAAFTQLLRETGIKVNGQVRTGLTPPEAPTLAKAHSPRLADLLGKVNKYSNNFMASQVARAVGAHVFGAPGTWNKAEKAMQRYLKKNLGLAPGSYTIKNASGLHDINRVSPRQVVRLLEYVYSQPRLRVEYLNSMAVTGGTGTLENRMDKNRTAGLLRGKTGTLSVASALSGYIYDPNGDLIIFSLLTNHYKFGLSGVLEVQNKLGDYLAATLLPSPAPLATSRKSP